ncbi:6-pyruvoyl trahydropterin synthase family protein [Pandoraea fibrosis]|uniref:6-carboxy-5,6,7,8-tetrahydropterin synthase n=1 Tax=Pandoraea fibrosis TaxID=1891094 RepID=A0A5E4U5X7_9BURK|nr:6-carboxytetrahydropterin synthase [Pandoraea fibrosis]VVD95450.1 6-carboxytetrahydropterin synthase [Pandoraea fibrosis]
MSRGGSGESPDGRERALKRTTQRKTRSLAVVESRAQFTLSRSFVFEAAHTLIRRDIDPPSIDASRRIHGHSYRATVEVTGDPQGESGMVLDLGRLDAELTRVRERLDHRLLDDVAGLGPATLENLCAFLWRALAPTLDGLSRVTVSRDARGDACSLTLRER